MIEEQAIVVDVKGQYVRVETDRQSSCGHCSAKNGCGSALLAKFFNRNKQHLIVENELSLMAGDKIVLGLNEDALLRGSFIVYAIPLLAMLITPMIVSQFIVSELASILSGLTGFIVGMIYVKYFSALARNGEHFRPVVLRRVDNKVTCSNSVL